MDKNTSVESLLNQLGSGSSSLFTTIRSGLKSLFDMGVKLEKSGSENAEGFTCKATAPDGTTYQIDASYLEGNESKLELVVRSEKTQRTHTIHKVPTAKFSEAAKQAIVKLGGDLTATPTAAETSENSDELDDATMTAATRIQVGLRKITCASGYDIELTAIGGAKNIQGIDPCDIVASIVEDNDFADTIPEEGQTYQVVLVDDGAQVETIETVDNQVTRISTIGMLAGLLDYLQDIHWNVHGEVFDHLHHAADCFHWDIRNAIDRLAEQEVMCNGAMPPMCEVRQDLPRPTSFDGNTLLEHFRDTVNSVASHLLMLAAVSEDSTRMMLSGIANSFAAEVDYKLTRRYDLGRVDEVPICP